MDCNQKAVAILQKIDVFEISKWSQNYVCECKQEKIILNNLALKYIFKYLTDSIQAARVLKRKLKMK